MAKLLHRSLLLVTLMVVASAVQAGDGSGPATIAVLPFQIFNAPDLAASAPGLQAALASRLALSGYRIVTPAAGESAGADWSVRTTLTRLGSRMTLDASLEPGTEGKASGRAFQTADSADGLLPALEALASSLRDALTVPPPAPAVAAPSAPATVPPPVPSSVPAPPPPAAQVAPAPPAPQPATLPTPAAPPGPAALSTPAALPGPVGAAPTENFSRYRLGSPLPGEARSVVVADVDRDGKPEILLLIDGRIVALRDDGAEPKVLWELPLATLPSAALLSAGDVDGDGTPEVFVAGLRDWAPVTLAYQWAGNGLTLHGPEVPAFLRAVAHPDRGALLLGMLPGLAKDLFGPTPRSFTWSDGTYRPDQAFSVPAGVSVIDMDWCRAARAGDPLLVATTQAGDLRLYDSGGKRLFQSPDPLKGSRNVLVGPERSTDSQDVDLVRIEGKTVAWASGDGSPHLIVHKNHGLLARYFQRSASFTHGQLLAYRWDGLTLVPTAEGPKIPGYFADLDLGPAPGAPSRRTLYAALVQSEGILSITYTTRVLAVDL